THSFGAAHPYSVVVPAAAFVVAVAHDDHTRGLSATQLSCDTRERRSHRLTHLRLVETEVQRRTPWFERGIRVSRLRITSHRSYSVPCCAGGLRAVAHVARYAAGMTFQKLCLEGSDAAVGACFAQQLASLSQIRNRSFAG